MVKRPTIHLIYPHGSSISCPDAIGRNLAKFLGETYPVRCYDLDHQGALTPEPGDILIGHPDPQFFTVFRASLGDPRWSRRLALIPFVHTDYTQCTFLDPLLARCDLLLAITGHYWASTLADSRFAHWTPKFRHLDLAVDPDHFPPCKSAFNPPGQRRFLYIGNHSWYKNLPFLQRIAAACPDMAFAWMGNRKNRSIPGFSSLGFMDFSTEKVRSQVAEYDFVLVGSSADANPTVILEAMAWGLIPVCTRECGYDHEPGIINIPLNDAVGTAAVLHQLQSMPAAELFELQSKNRARLTEHYHWSRFAAQVRQAIEDAKSPPLTRQTFWNRIALCWHALRSERSAWRPRNLSRALRNRFLKAF